jgi:hypothetical protein
VTRSGLILEEKLLNPYDVLSDTGHDFLIDCLLQDCNTVQFAIEMLCSRFSFLLCLALHAICTREALDVLLDIALVSQELNICTIDQNTALFLQIYVLLPSQWCETPVLAHNDLLSARKLVHRSSQSLDCGGSVAIKSAD